MPFPGGSPDFGERWRRARRLLCPACGRGAPFKGLLEVRRRCDACGYSYQREAGYFIGSIYFNYGVTTGLLIAGFFLFEALWGLTFWQQAPIGVIFSALFPFWFLRYARSLWMMLDLLIAPPEATDFTAPLHPPDARPGRRCTGT